MSTKSNDDKASKATVINSTLKKLKAQRRGHRARITVLLNEIKAIQLNTESDVKVLSRKAKALKTQKTKLIFYNKEILKYIQEEEQEIEVVETEEMNEIIEDCLDEVSSLISKFKQESKLKEKTRSNESLNSLHSNKSSNKSIKSNDSKHNSKQSNQENQEDYEVQYLNKLKNKIKMQRQIMQENLEELNDQLNKKEVSIARVESLRTVITNLQTSINYLVEELLSKVAEEEYLLVFKENNLFQLNIEEQLEDATTFINKNKETTNSLSSKTCNHSGTNFRLERISIPKFGGDITQYLTWKTSFLAAVDSQNMSIAEKHQHLRSSLTDNALKLISGLPQTDQYYKETLDILDSNFDDEIKIVQNHLDTLFGLPTPEYSYQSLLNFNATFENNLRAIQSHNIGITPTDSSIIIGHIISGLLPKQVKQEVHEIKKGKHWSIDLVRTALQESIKYLRVDNRDNKNEREKNKIKILNKTSWDTKPNQRGNYGKFNYPQSTMAATVFPAERKKPEPDWACRYCNKNTHFETDCDEYTSLASRRKRLYELKLCSSCLRQGHTWQNCEGTYKPCYHCKKHNHVTSVCPQHPNFNKTSTKESSSNQEKPTHRTGAIPKVTSASCNIKQSKLNMKSVALPLAVLQINQNDKVYNVKTLLDSASQRTLINKKLVNKMKLRPYGQVELQLNGINKEGEINFYDLVTLKVITNKEPIQLEALVIDKLPKELNIPELSRVTKTLLDMGIRLANPNQGTDQIKDIELIIGSDFYPLFEAKPYKINEINLLDTNVDSMIWGILPNSKNNNKNLLNTVSIFHVNVHPPPDIYGETAETSHDLDRLWNLSHIGINLTDLTVVEKTVMDDFTNNIKFENGKYTVKLPWRTVNPNLPDNYCTAKRIMYSTINKLKREPEKLQMYNQIIKEQKEMGFIEEIKPNEQLHPDSMVHYLPHHGVFKDSTTSPLRIVFNSSSGSPSLNDNLWPGPCLLQNLCVLLLKFRMKQWATVSDIAKAFHNVTLYEGDRDSTRFLWVRDPSNPYSKIKTFRFRVVVFGINSSPFLLNACIQHHLSNSDSPLATTIAHNIYVDNILGTFDTKEEVLEYYKTANTLLSEAGFYLREWNSNEPNAKQIFQQEERSSESEIEKVLGMRWNTTNDTILYNKRDLDQEADTKRAVLSAVASIFDVQGYINPILIKGKMFLQKLWKANLRWDDSLSFYQPELKLEWKSICKSLQQAVNLEIPRQLIFHHDVELHAFSDASGKAYGSAIYIISNEQSRLLISKVRVAPIKELTIPKMELTAALLSARLLTFVIESFGTHINVKNIYCWVDSQVTLRWINSKNQLPAYIQNRVEEIRKLIPGVEWKYVPTESNPSDYLSRGVPYSKLISDLWLKGPSWLIRKEEWPVWSEQMMEEREVEVKHSLVTTISNSNKEIEEESTKIFCINNYSSLRKLYRITQLVLRFVRNLRTSKDIRQKSSYVNKFFSHQFTSLEIEESEKYWLQQIQRESFPKEVLTENKKFSPSSKYHQLNAFFHQNSGLLRCNRRLENASLDYDTKYPILLPNEHHYVKLLTKDLHESHSHLSVPHLITLIRTRYYFFRMRQVSRNVVRKCVLCKRLQGVHYPPSPNSVLPSGRVNECTPFQVIGLDYTGYFKVKNENATVKVYIALFSCAVTRAVHLEMVEDNSVSNFLQAFRRFVARRGLPSCIYSDNATYFVAASDYLRKLHTLPSVKDYLNQHKIKWLLNPSRASFVGGHFERLIGIVKSCLKKTLSTSFVTKEEFSTILIETESTVNSRPLTYVSDQFDDDNPLTPQELINGYNIKRLPVPLEYLEEDEDYNQVTIKTRYKRVLKNIEKFWVRWKREYLLHLRQRNTVSGQTQIQKGDVVLIENDGPRLKWKLGLVVKLHTGQDGFTRSVTVKTGNGEITRATVHLYPLEINCNLESPLQKIEETTNTNKSKRSAHILARERIKSLFESN